MKRSPDCLKSWIIAVACCFINMMMYGMGRLSGVLFVASVHRFNVGREKASFPYTFAHFMSNTTGPLVGYLGHKFGVRAVTTFGCLLGTFGIFLCYFAENIPTIIVFWGTIFGLGFGLGNVLLPVSINQYFDKHRAMASGISYSGASLGSFALPPIVEILLNTYGLSGTFLVLAGFSLNCVPAALLLKKPHFEIDNEKDQSQQKCVSGERQSTVSGKKVKLCSVEDGCQGPTAFAFKRLSEPAINSAGSIILKSANNLNQLNGALNPPLTYEERIKRLSTQTPLSDYSVHMSSPEPLDLEQIIQNSKSRRIVDHTMLDRETNNISSQMTDQDINSEKDEVFVKENTPSDFRVNMHQRHKKPCEETYKKSRTLSTESFLPFSEVSKETCQYSNSYNEIYCNSAYQRETEDDHVVCVKSEKEVSKPSFSFTPTVSSSSATKTEEKSALSSFSIILDPMFILIAFTNAFCRFTFVCMVTVIVDYARDINVGITNEKYVLMSLSVGDLIGRLALGWITDSGYMTKTNFAAFCFMSQGIATAAIAWSTGFPLLIAIVAFYGISEGGVILIFPLLVAQFIEKHKQTIAIPSSNFFTGPLCLAVSPLIGYFRDDIGSYDYIFYGIAIVSGLCCFAWLLAPCIAKCGKPSCD